jgi:hypothetical protein
MVRVAAWLSRNADGAKAIDDASMVRAVTIPDCVALARREKRTFNLQVEIIDPTDDLVCRKYADYRRSLTPQPDRSGETWTADRTRKESFATIVAACWYRRHFTLLDVELSEEPTIDEVRKLLRAVGLELSHAFGDLEVSDIIRRAINAPNLYE